MKRKGKLVVIDGADGSGKATQVKLLADALRTEGYRVKTIDFPRYEDNFMGGFIGECLHGEHGDFLEVDPHIVSVLYAADRFESRKTLEKWLKNGYVIVADRYVSANQIHQGGKISNASARSKFLRWLDGLEFEVFGLPRPDFVFYLDVPQGLSQQLLQQDGKKLDTAEKNQQYQENSRKSAEWLQRNIPEWQKIHCSKNGYMKTREVIHQEIYAVLRDTIL